VQLPNWWEFVVTALACGRIGAVVNPLMPIFRERELSYMLEFAEVKVLVVPKLFRGFDHEAMAEGMRAGLPKLEHVIVVDGSGENGFERRLLQGNDRVPPAASIAESPLQPDDLAVLMFTSGTTGSPKGVMHTSNTLIACLNALSGRFGLDTDDVMHVASPMGHMTGYAAVMLLGIRLAATIVLQDVWEAKQGVTIMLKEGVSYTAASTPFLTDICDTVAGGLPRPTRLRSFLCGGAPIPPVLIERAARELDLKVCSLWGMTESLSSTLTEPSPRCREVVVDGRTRARRGRRQGRRQRRQDVAERHDRKADGARRAALRRLLQDAPISSHSMPKAGSTPATSLHGRRGLHPHQWPHQGRPDPRRRERPGGRDRKPAAPASGDRRGVDRRLPGRAARRACVRFVVLKPGKQLSLADVQSWMNESKVAKQYWPERLAIFGTCRARLRARCRSSSCARWRAAQSNA
jgi:cyclohexanecarboxylate-CoA ligase